MGIPLCDETEGFPKKGEAGRTKHVKKHATLKFFGGKKEEKKEPLSGKKKKITESSGGVRE